MARMLRVFAPAPDLSATSHPSGTEGRSNAPVTAPGRIQSANISCELSLNTLPVSIVSRSAIMAAGVEVSRSSPAARRFSSGSIRSNRETSSPRVRKNSVTPAGPPARSISRFVAVLSLWSMEARHSSPTVIVPPTWSRVTGAYSRMSVASTGTASSNETCPASTPDRIAPQTGTLTVLFIRNRSSARCRQSRPVPVSCAATPMRAPSFASSAAMVASSGSAACACVAEKANRAAARRRLMAVSIKICHAKAITRLRHCGETTKFRVCHKIDSWTAPTSP